MPPADLFRYDEGAERFSLYLAELSTSEGLAFFEPGTPLSMTAFGATGYLHLGWATERDLPPLDTVGAARAFLDALPTLGLIDFAARLGHEASLSSHDDGECQLRFSSRQALTAVLCQAVPPDDGGKLVHAVLRNPGRYVAREEGGAIALYASFDAYLAARGRRA